MKRIKQKMPAVYGLSINNVAQLSGLSKRTVAAMCRSGRVRGARRYSGQWVISPATVIMRGRGRNAGYAVSRPSETEQRQIDTVQAARQLGLSRRRVQQMCQRGEIPGARKVGRVWVIRHG